jgi:hypothetical protein
MTDTGTHPVPDADRHAAVVAEYQRAGYSVIDEADGETTLRRRDHGGLVAHIVLFFTVGFWTLGLANLVYAWRRRRKSTARVTVITKASATVRADEETAVEVPR